MRGRIRNTLERSKKRLIRCSTRRTAAKGRREGGGDEGKNKKMNTKGMLDSYHAKSSADVLIFYNHRETWPHGSYLLSKKKKRKRKK